MIAATARVAQAIGEPARAAMLYALLDGRARTATELATLAGVAASTASAHLRRLEHAKLIQVAAQGRHRYVSLASAEVARVLEALGVLAGQPGFVPKTPHHLRAARTCYDHIAGWLGVALHDRMLQQAWLTPQYALSRLGGRALARQGVDLNFSRRRRAAFACLDWSERRPHLAGALAAALLQRALTQGWVRRDPGARSLEITHAGWRDWLSQYGLRRPPPA